MWLSFLEQQNSVHVLGDCVFFQGMLTLVSNCIDRLNVYNSAAHFGECAGSEAGAAWKDILNLLYELLGNKPVKHTHID